MKFEDSLVCGQIVANYKNIIVDVMLDDGDEVSAFCPEQELKNQLYKVGARVWLEPSEEKRRRVPFVCQLTDCGEGRIFVNNKYKNQLFAEAFKSGALDEVLGSYKYIREIQSGEELKYVNFELIDDEHHQAFVYVVNIFNKQGTAVVFPSMINFFEIEMFAEMQKMRRQGAETVVFLVVPREDCANIRFVWNQDPVAAAKIYDEVQSGLKFCGYRCRVSPQEVKLIDKLEIMY